MKLDSAVADLLEIDLSKATVTSAGGGGCSSASTYKITYRDSQVEKSYFMKTGKGSAAKSMFIGENASLRAIHDIVPNLCPNAYGTGQFSSTSSTFFLVTDFLNLHGSSRGSRNSSQTLAQKLAKLHTTPAPIPEDFFSKPMFGFPCQTSCGDTLQSNKFTETWPDFYANHRLRFIAEQCKQKNGKDPELSNLIESIASEVVPALLGKDHLGGATGIMPVVTHGDLWSGNAGTAIIGASGTQEEVIFDPSAVYAHNEYELGIMKMFGGFGGAFLKEYHEFCPKTEPVEEYADRIALYEL